MTVAIRDTAPAQFWSHLLKESLMENFIFGVVQVHGHCQIHMVHCYKSLHDRSSTISPL